MKGCILAGGLGKRLRPITLEMPKPLIPIQGQPLLKHVIDLMKAGGVTDITIAAGYKADMVQDFLDKQNGGCKYQLLIEDTPLGTGGWMKLMDRPEEDMFVFNGDNLFGVDLQAMKKQHQETGAVITIATTLVDDPTAYGIMSVDGTKIIDWVEKPSKEDAPSNQASSGYYLFSPQAWDYLPPGEKFMLEDDVFPAALNDGTLHAFASDKQWFDTGTPERWSQVIEKWKHPHYK